MATKCQRPEEDLERHCLREELKGEQQFVEPAGVINQSSRTIDDDSRNKTDKGNNNEGILNESNNNEGILNESKNNEGTHNKDNNNKSNKNNNNGLLNNDTKQEASSSHRVASDRDDEATGARPSYQFHPNSGADTQQSNQINLHTITTTRKEVRRTSPAANTTPTRAPTATCLTAAMERATPLQQTAVTKKLALHRTRSAPANCLHHQQEEKQQHQHHEHPQQQQQHQHGQQHHEHQHQQHDEDPQSSNRQCGVCDDDHHHGDRGNSDAGHGNVNGEVLGMSAKKAGDLERNGVFEVIQIPEKQRFGCAHYKRRAMFVTPCCQKFYNCRFCHDENEAHHFDRKTLTELICSECNTRQRVQERCEACGVGFGKYTCLICNLFDDSDKQQYHCDACGICRIGGAANFFHCAVCDMCLPIQLKIEGHRCVENVSRSHCPVCLGDIHTSRIPCHIPDCGHLLHKMCFDQLLDSGHYTCPTCQTSLMDMTALWEYLDQQALLMPIPHKYENQRIHIFCNDCHQTSKTKFHYIGLKCLQCGAYNTTQDVKRRMSLVTDEPSSA